MIAHKKIESQPKTPQYICNLIDKLLMARHKAPHTSTSHIPPIFFEFFNRFLENNRAIIVLLDSGFINEAQVLQRLSIEHFSNMIALLKIKSTVDQMYSQANYELIKQGRQIQNTDKKHPVLTHENHESLGKFLEESDAPNSGLNVYDKLMACGLDFIYTKYRDLSIRTAHSTLVSAICTGTQEDENEVLAFASELLKLSIVFFQKSLALPESPSKR